MRIKGEKTDINSAVSGIRKNQTVTNWTVQMCNGLIESSAVHPSSSRTKMKKTKAKKSKDLCVNKESFASSRGPRVRQQKMPPQIEIANGSRCCDIFRLNAGKRSRSPTWRWGRRLEPRQMLTAGAIINSERRSRHCDESHWTKESMVFWTGSDGIDWRRKLQITATKYKYLISIQINIWCNNQQIVLLI